MVLKLNKGLYGLKQSGRLWHQKLDSELLSMGFTKVRCDNSIWVYRKDSIRVIIPVFVDDMTIASNDPSQITWVKQELQKRFKLRDLGKTSFLLGVKVERDRTKRTLQLSQTQYMLDMLDRYGFADCSPVTTPMEPVLVVT